MLFSQSNTKLFINGEFVESKTDRWIDIHNPVSAYSQTLGELINHSLIFRAILLSF